MALINCPECKKEISDTAGACPSCGFSIKATTIEQTGKKYKDAQVLGCVSLIVGLFIVIFGHAWGGIVLFVGLCVYLWARYSAWYNHG